MTKILNDLRAARDLLTRRTWQQGSMFNSDRSCFCALGACRLTAPAPGRQDRYQDMEEALHAALPSPYLTVPAFNDDATTDLAAVHALFDRAIHNHSS